MTHCLVDTKGEDQSVRDDWRQECLEREKDFLSPTFRIQGGISVAKQLYSNVVLFLFGVFLL